MTGPEHWPWLWDVNWLLSNGALSPAVSSLQRLQGHLQAGQRL